MLQNVTNYHYPGSLDEALSLHNRESRSYFIAGGTGLALSESRQPIALIDLNRLGLDKLKTNSDTKKITVGATTKIQTLVKGQEITHIANDYLSESLEKVGSYPVRNAGTLGGSIVRPFPWSDVIPILLTLDATVEYYDGSHGSRSLENLYEKEFRSTLRNSIVTGLNISLPEEGVTMARFFKFARSEFDVSSLNLGCRVTIHDGRIAEARLVVGARPSFAQRLYEMEETLAGNQASDVSGRHFSELAKSSVEVGGDQKMSEEYRRAQVKKMTEDAINQIITDYDQRK